MQVEPLVAKEWTFEDVQPYHGKPELLQRVELSHLVDEAAQRCIKNYTWVSITKLVGVSKADANKNTILNNILERIFEDMGRSSTKPSDVAQ